MKPRRYPNRPSKKRVAATFAQLDAAWGTRVTQEPREQPQEKEREP